MHKKHHFDITNPKIFWGTVHSPHPTSSVERDTPFPHLTPLSIFGLEAFGASMF